MKSSSSIVVFLSMLLMTFLLFGCAHQPLPATPGAPGFLLGLLHGFIAPVSFIASLFTDYRIYQFPNSGLWYDFGFMIGISGFSGGIFKASRHK
ncbi:MAG: hypothetical protein WC209_00445 [Ignavibacteriaceae bacterium]|jgi:hypothetical protein